ncbi:MAG: hypothetical protein KAG99_03315, partial [Bacteroidales bacterium]|nr:hypothetical protein [Bacteroidales bacterium]
QVIKNKNVLNGNIIEMAGEETTVEEGKAIWKLPEIVKDGIVHLLLKDIKGNVIGDAAIPVHTEPRTPVVTEVIDKSYFKIPDYIRAGDPAVITGVFDGDFSTSGIKINGVEPKILAESPVGVFFETPVNIDGLVDIELTEGEFTVESQTNVVDLELLADRLTLTSGGQATVTITVTGLNDLNTPVPVEITNLTPTNINMQGGDNQRILIDPEDVAADGTYTREVEVTAIQAGGFSVLVNIKPERAGMVKLLSPQPETEFAAPNVLFNWQGIGLPNDVNYTLKIFEAPYSQFLNGSFDFDNESQIALDDFIREFGKEEWFYSTSVIESVTTSVEIDLPSAGLQESYSEYIWYAEAAQGGELIFSSLPGTFYLFPDTIMLAIIKGPTYGVPGVTRTQNGKLNFANEKAVRKWVNINGAKKQLKKLVAKRDSQKRYYEKIKNNPGLKKCGTVDGTLNRIKKLNSKIELVKKYLEKADKASKACNLEDTRKYSQYAKEAAETGVNTGGSNFGFPKPKNGGTTVPGRNNENAEIDKKYKEKFTAISDAIKKIEEMERKLEDLETDNIYGDEKIKEYEKRLEELKKKLAEAEKNLAEMKKRKAYSLESVVIQEVAEEVVVELKNKIIEFEKGLKKVKEKQKDKKAQEEQKKAIKNLNKDLRNAYKQLLKMYGYMKKCNTKKVKECGTKIQVIADKNDENNSISELDGVANDAESAGGTAKNATSNKIPEMEKADKTYFEGLYESLFANFKKMSGKAPKPVNDFLGFKGDDYKKVASFECDIGGIKYIVNINLKWSFGATPKPDSTKPSGEVDDGYYEHPYTYNCTNPININIDAKVILYWVGPFSEMASDKALLYHEFLHGQLMVEWLKQPVNQAKICEALKKNCSNNPSKVDIPLADSVDNEHDKIYEWQPAFQDAIQ